MNPAPYELWSEHFSPVLRINPLWDTYDRLLLELFRKKKAKPVIVEFGLTRHNADPQSGRYFTPQMEWLAENELATCLAITQDSTPGIRYRHTKVLVPTSEVTEEIVVPDWFDVVASGVQVGKADAIVLSEPMAGAWDFEKLQPGTLVCADSAWGITEKTKLQRILAGPMTIWRKP